MNKVIFENEYIELLQLFLNEGEIYFSSTVFGNTYKYFQIETKFLSRYSYKINYSSNLRLHNNDDGTAYHISEFNYRNEIWKVLILRLTYLSEIILKLVYSREINIPEILCKLNNAKSFITPVSEIIRLLLLFYYFLMPFIVTLIIVLFFLIFLGSDLSNKILLLFVGVPTKKKYMKILVYSTS